MSNEFTQPNINVDELCIMSITRISVKENSILQELLLYDPSEKLPEEYYEQYKKLYRNSREERENEDALWSQNIFKLSDLLKRYNAKKN